MNSLVFFPRFNGRDVSIFFSRKDNYCMLEGIIACLLCRLEQKARAVVKIVIQKLKIAETSLRITVILHNSAIDSNRASVKVNRPD